MLNEPIRKKVEEIRNIHKDLEEVRKDAGRKLAEMQRLHEQGNERWIEKSRQDTAFVSEFTKRAKRLSEAVRPLYAELEEYYNTVNKADQTIRRVKHEKFEVDKQLEATRKQNKDVLNTISALEETIKSLKRAGLDESIEKVRTRRDDLEQSSRKSEQLIKDLEQKKNELEEAEKKLYPILEQEYGGQIEPAEVVTPSAEEGVDESEQPKDQKKEEIGVYAGKKGDRESKETINSMKSRLEQLESEKGAMSEQLKSAQLYVAAVNKQMADARTKETRKPAPTTTAAEKQTKPAEKPAERPIEKQTEKPKAATKTAEEKAEEERRRNCEIIRGGIVVGHGSGGGGRTKPKRFSKIVCTATVMAGLVTVGWFTWKPISTTLTRTWKPISTYLTKLERIYKRISVGPRIIITKEPETKQAPTVQKQVEPEEKELELEKKPIIRVRRVSREEFERKKERLLRKNFRKRNSHESNISADRRA